ncbi:hypothetical protein ACLB2K_034442 [Fragaria x ananassa]
MSSEIEAEGALGIEGTKRYMIQKGYQIHPLLFSCFPVPGIKVHARAAIKPAEITWTAVFRKQHKKDSAPSRSLADQGATLEVIQKQRTSEKPETSDAAPPSVKFKENQEDQG